MGDKGIAQVTQTASKVDAKYGLVISRSSLNYFAKENIVQIPLNYFLLV